MQMLEEHINGFPFHMFRSEFCFLWLKDYVHIVLHHVNLVIWTAIPCEYCLSSEVRGIDLQRSGFWRTD